MIIKKIIGFLIQRWKILVSALGFLLLVFYVGGFLRQIFCEASIDLNPLICMKAGISPEGIRFSLAAALLFVLIAGVVIWRGNGKEVAGRDEERNFEYSTKGTYGTAGFMKKEEQKTVLESHKDIREAAGVIFGTDLEDGSVISLPVDSYLNRNFAVCGSQGSMKSRAFARMMALQCIKRGESIYLTDPKSELYEDLVVYLREEGYVCRRLNLIDLIHSDAWDCLGEIGDGGLIDTFVDVVIRNTTDKFDHFYDNVEMDLLKALCLYVYEEYPPGRKTFPEAYNLLLNKSVEMLDSIFENLPSSHPAKGPYRLFSKAEKVKGNAVLGLGTRLQILQNKTVQELTSHQEIDLSLPGKQKCAYFCITSDQDSTYNVLATLFTSFLCIKLVRLADHTPNRKLPVPVHFILDEFPNIGVVPDFTKKLATARSRALGISILYQNIPQLQNRYPDNQWEEILGGCDFSLFLGCNDITTAEYFSKRSGEITVAVDSVRKNYYTIRMTDYVPEYSESSSVGKRQLLLPDEVLRLAHDEALLFIRGQKMLRLHKLDYSKHPAAEFLKLEKTTEYVPEWRREETVKTQADMVWEYPGETEEESGVWDTQKIMEEREPVGEDEQQKILEIGTEVKKKDRNRPKHQEKQDSSTGTMQKEKTENRKYFMKVEDLFANPDKGGEEEND